MVEALRTHINQNSVSWQKTIAKEMNIAPRTLSCVLQDDLGLRAFKRRKGQLLTLRLSVLQCERVKKLLRLYSKGKYKKILFTDEKSFMIGWKLNRQNDRLYAWSPSEVSEKISGSSVLTTSLTSWYGREYYGTVLLPFIFVRKGWKHQLLCIRSPFWSLSWRT